MSRISEIEVFVAVVDAGSMTKAARRLGISKSYASRVIQKLENRLGVQLLNRNSRSISVTAAGEAYHTRTSTALEMLEAAERLVAQEQEQPRGLLRLTAPMSFGLRFVARALAQFQLSSPDVTVEVHYADRLMNVVEDGYDLAIRVGDLADSELVARKLASSELHLAASRTYLDKHGTPSHPTELENHELLVYTVSTRPFLIERGDEQIEVAVTGRHRANNGDALAIAACSGLGITAGPDWLLSEDIDSGRLVRVLPDWASPPFGVWAVFPPGRQLLPKVAGFIDQLSKVLDDAGVH